MTGILAKIFKKNRVRPGEILFQVANLLSMVLSIAVVAGGGYLLYTFDRYSPIFKTFVFRNVGQLITLLGSFGIAFTFVGCLFFHYKKKGLVGLYVISVVIIYCGEVGAGLVLIEKKTEVRNSTKEVLDVIIDHYYGLPGHELETASIDTIQRKMQCCGVDSWQDWLTSSLMQRAKAVFLFNTSTPTEAPEFALQSESTVLHLLLSGTKPLFFFNPKNQNHVKHVFSHNVSDNDLKQAVPVSCCSSTELNCRWRGPWNVHQEGCITFLTQEFSELAELTGIVIAVIGFLQVLGTTIGACVVKCFKGPSQTRNLPI